MSSLYIHIPYCRQACHYCDFHFSTFLSNMDAMVSAICREIELRNNFFENKTLKTLYFGGGTPSMLSYRHWELIFEEVHRHYTINSDAEITMEVNPDDVNTELLNTIKTFGFNRVSLGIQSFDDARLQLMNRVHTANEADAAYNQLRAGGCKNISIDLIYGFKGASTIWSYDVQKALQLKPEHISSYCLTIEPGTVYAHKTKIGLGPASSSDTAAEDYRLMVNALREAGYIHYEISNFGLPGKESLHNSNYWSGNPYLGIGPGAHSFDGKSRMYNIENNPKYIASINYNKIPETIEKLSDRDIINEALLTGLRTRAGLAYNWPGFEQDRSKLKRMEAFVESKLVETTDTGFRLTLQGMLLADAITEKLWTEG